MRLRTQATILGPGHCQCNRQAEGNCGGQKDRVDGEGYGFGDNGGGRATRGVKDLNASDDCTERVRTWNQSDDTGKCKRGGGSLENFGEDMRQEACDC